MEKLTGRIVGQVIDVDRKDGKKEKRFHYFVETAPGKQGKPAKWQEIVVEGEPPYQKSATLHPIIDRHCQVEGSKLQTRLMVKKENVRLTIDIPRTRGKK